MPAFRFMRSVIRPVVRYYNHPRIVQHENMPVTGPCFIFANHSSNFDPFLINYEMTGEPTTGVMTRYQFFKTLPRLFMSSAGVIPTSKYVPEPEVIRSVMKMLERNRMILIFPEGGRRWDGRPKPLIEATIKLFRKMNVPVHPVQIHGSYLSWPRWADHPRRNRMDIRWLPPLHPGHFDDYDSFSRACHNAIAIDENDPPEPVLPYAARKPAAGIQRILYRCPETGVQNAVYSPDGIQLLSRRAPEFRLLMNASSELEDGSGRKAHVTEIFDRINDMPLYRDYRNIVIPDTPCTVNRISDEHRLQNPRHAHIRLTTSHIEIRWGSDRRRLPVEDIQFISIEKNHKLMLTTSGDTFLITLGKRSALQWQLYIRRLQSGEQAVKTHEGVF